MSDLPRSAGLVPFDQGSPNATSSKTVAGEGLDCRGLQDTNRRLDQPGENSQAHRPAGRAAS